MYNISNYAYLALPRVIPFNNWRGNHEKVKAMFRYLIPCSYYLLADSSIYDGAGSKLHPGEIGY
jgi:hypothetical protein